MFCNPLQRFLLVSEQKKLHLVILRKELESLVTTKCPTCPALLGVLSHAGGKNKPAQPDVAFLCCCKANRATTLGTDCLW